MTVRASSDETGTGLVASARLEVLDLYGVPYRVGAAPSGQLESLSAPEGRAIYWPSGGKRGAGWSVIDGIPLFAPIVPDDELERLGRTVGAAWEPCVAIVDRDGRQVSSVRRAPDGSVLLPFDPNRAATSLLREHYLALTSSGGARLAKDIARRAYYRVRPIVPRRAQIALRRRFTEVQQRATFPSWPTETALHDLREWMLAVVQHAWREPLPQIGWWPDGARWAVVLTHDVERARGYGFVEQLVSIEARYGMRSAWYFVPERDYRVDDELVRRLTEDGSEVCVHGLRHDGRDLQPGVFEKRLPAMRSYAERWGSIGFRAPSTQRSPEAIAALGCDHDSSYSDVARFEPQGGGSCSWLPFFFDDVVELPITMPMDHTLFELLGHTDEKIWVEKAGFLRDRGGMALMLTHPDYLQNETTRSAYEAFLAHVARDATAWHALPRDVSDWWRRRAASRLTREGDAWVVQGPAWDASVVSVDRPLPFVA
ncbi:MAG TPA: hypothetical protein VFJ60_06610 [Gaiella sp.]|nr:hypothetical protein [Gaiella sp.]